MYQKYILLKLFKSEAGNTSAIIICITAVIIMLAAVLTDIGYAALEHYELLKCAKEMAKAGASYAAWDKPKAEKVMKEYAVNRISGLNSLNVRISSSGKEITVSMIKHLEYLFLRYLGVKGKNVEVGITAKLSGIYEYKGIRPFAVKRQKFEFNREYSLVNKETYVSGSIPYLLLDLGEKDPPILYGYRKSLKTGSGVYALKNSKTIQIENGIKQLIKKCYHQPECTYLSYQKNCSRIIIIPVVDNLNLDSPMKVEGFAAFFLEDVKIDENNLSIKGSFLRYTADSATNDAASDFGLLSVEIIQ